MASLAQADTKNKANIKIWAEAETEVVGLHAPLLKGLQGPPPRLNQIENEDA